jgi:hypothetical protein
MGGHPVTLTLARALNKARLNRARTERLRSPGRRAVIAATMRARFDGYASLPADELARIDDGRVVPVAETRRLFEMAMRGELEFAAKGTT